MVDRKRQRQLSCTTKKRRLSIVIGLCVSLFINNVSWGQTTPICTDSLTGYIQGQDNKSGAETLPLTGATVYIQELKKGAVADVDGRFQLGQLCPGTYTLDYQFVGYKSLVKTIRIPLSDSTAATVTLMAENVTLNEVVVTEHRSEAQQLLQTQVSLSGKALDQTRGESLGESLKSLAGLYSIQTGPSISKPVIHGLYSNPDYYSEQRHSAGRPAVGHRTRPAGRSVSGFAADGHQGRG